MAKLLRQEFKLRFPTSSIRELAGRYSFESDDAALQAGARIRAGNFTRNNLEVIFDWKTSGRGRSRIKKNSDAEIADALRLAVCAETDRASMAVLCGLSGVQVPVASAILTAIYPGRFTIIDFRALESLGVKEKPSPPIDFYLAYLDECRKSSQANKVTLRELDRALWQWSKENGQNLTDRISE